MNKAFKKRILLYIEAHPGEFSAEELHDWMKNCGFKFFPSAKNIAAILTRMPEVRRIGPSTWIPAEAVQ